MADDQTIQALMKAVRDAGLPNFDEADARATLKNLGDAGRSLSAPAGSATKIRIANTETGRELLIRGDETFVRAVWDLVDSNIAEFMFAPVSSEEEA